LRLSQLPNTHVPASYFISFQKLALTVDEITGQMAPVVNSKKSDSGAGGMGFKSRADHTSHTLPTTRHREDLIFSVDEIGVLRLCD